MAVYELDGIAPQIADSAWVADSAQAIGRVTLEAEASLWFGVVARGDTDQRSFPWGDEVPDCSQANVRPTWEGEGANTVEPCINDTVAVGSYPDGASPFGVLDMAGNVAEWVADWYQPQYYETSTNVDPDGPDQGWDGYPADQPSLARVSRGGNFATGYAAIQVFTRYVEPDWASSNGLGFRCARPLTPPS